MSDEKVIVQIIESEAGWGNRVDETKEFDNRADAEQFVKEYNNKYNPPGKTPEWYMYARIVGDKRISMLR